MSERTQEAMKYFSELVTDGGNVDTKEKLEHVRFCWNMMMDMQAQIKRQAAHISEFERQNTELKVKLEEALHTSSVRSNLVNKKTLENAELLELVEQMQKRVRYFLKHQDLCSDEDNEYAMGKRHACESIIKILTETVEAAKLKPCPAS